MKNDEYVLKGFFPEFDKVIKKKKRRPKTMQEKITRRRMSKKWRDVLNVDQNQDKLFPWL